MKVAVLVHNDVVRDTRVRKGIRTLTNHGVEVSVVGIGSEAGPQSPLEGEQSFVLLSKPLQRVRKNGFFSKLKRYSPIRTIAVVGAIVLVIEAPETWLTKGVLVALILGVWFNSIAKNGLRSVVKSFRGILARFATWALYSRILSDEVQRQGEFDVIWCHDIIALKAGALIKKRQPSVRMIWDAHEIYEDLASGGALQSWVQRKMISNSQRFVDEFIVINESFQGFYSKYTKLPRARIVMNATRYAAPPEDDGRLREATGLSPRRKILLFQGGFSLRRGIATLIDAVPLIDEPWSVVFMGWGPLESFICAAAVKANQGRATEEFRICVIPPASNHELASWTAGADLGIIPYEDFGLNHRFCTPNKLWEYPNAGVPILATGFPEIEKIVTEWNLGELLPINFDENSIASSVSELTEAKLNEYRRNCETFSLANTWQSFEPEILAAVGV